MVGGGRDGDGVGRRCSWGRGGGSRRAAAVVTGRGGVAGSGAAAVVTGRGGVAGSGAAAAAGLWSRGGGERGRRWRWDGAAAVAGRRRRCGEVAGSGSGAAAAA